MGISLSRDKNLDPNHLRNVPKKSMAYQELQASFQQLNFYSLFRHTALVTTSCPQFLWPISSQKVL